MPILAQELIPITITKNHDVLINKFKQCACVSKSELVNITGYDKHELMNTLKSLTAGGLIHCDDTKCCVNSESFGSFIHKLNKLK